MPAFEDLVFLTLKRFLHDISSPSRVEEVWPQLKEHPLYQHCASKWASLSTRKRRKAWEKLAHLIEKIGYATRPYCLRCGTCCRKGSPALYLEDAFLVSSGHLPKEALFTLRPGEQAYSNQEEKVVALKREIIKIKEHKGRQCIFFQPKDNTCGIYEFRPLQCQVMKCWQPEDFAVLKKKRLLQRKDIIGANNPLWAVISLHEKRCKIAEMRYLLKHRDKDKKARQKLREMINYDIHIRRFLEETFGIPPKEQDFYLGRPLSLLVNLYQSEE